MTDKKDSAKQKQNNLWKFISQISVFGDPNGVISLKFHQGL